MHCTFRNDPFTWKAFTDNFPKDQCWIFRPYLGAWVYVTKSKCNVAKREEAQIRHQKNLDEIDSIYKNNCHDFTFMADFQYLLMQSVQIYDVLMKLKIQTTVIALCR